jgi:hypothetical protein
MEIKKGKLKNIIVVIKTFESAFEIQRSYEMLTVQPLLDKNG